MKNLFSFAMLFYVSISFGQFELEHTYPDGIATRVNFETWGEKYYLFKSDTNEMVFYNADHSWWKTVALPASAPTMFTSTRIFHVSETEINPDSGIEIVFGHYNHVDAYFESKIVNDSGVVLLAIPNAVEVSLSKIPGLPDKLITKNNDNLLSKVYSLPDLNFETSYNTGNIQRTKLETLGEKYYLINKSTTEAVIYNADHSPWKTISLPKPDNMVYTPEGIDFISENLVDPDALLEIGYSYYSVAGNLYTYQGKIINENGLVLLTVPGTSSFRINELAGYADKLITTQVGYSSMTGEYYTSNVYALPGLALEKAYDMEVTRVNLENSGEKYYGFRNLIDGHTNVYNPDHTLWKTIYFDIPIDAPVPASVSFISETKIADDALLEIGYAYTYYSPLMYTVFHGQVINEDGMVYLDSPYLLNYTLSEFSNLPTKLIAVRILSDPFDDTNMNYQSDVYNVDAAMATDDFQKAHTINLTPNPSSSVVNIDSSDTIIEVVVFDALGATVLRHQYDAIKTVNIAGLKTGIYFLRLSDSNNKQSVHKIIVAH